MTGDLLKAAKILIVDDDLVMIRLVEEILTGAGYINLSVTNDSRVAVAMYTDAKPDLVLLDLNMPYQDGYQVLHALRKDEPAESPVPIIVITADRKPDTRGRAEADGATDFLLKPFENTEVLWRVEVALLNRIFQKQLQREKKSVEQRVKERTRNLERMIAELRCAEWPLFSTYH